MKPITKFLLVFLLLIASDISLATRPASTGFFTPELKQSNGKNNNNNNNKGNGGNNEGGAGGFFGPGGGFGIPGFDNGFGNGIGAGYGFGDGGPNGGYSKGGVIRSTVVCKEKGPCYQKKLTCPAKCFTSFSRSGKGYGSGGGGGGCTMDCKKKCIAYC